LICDPIGPIATALNFLVYQIHATYQKTDIVTTLLSLGMTWAFDRAVPAWLLNNKKKRKFPEYIVKCVSSFISDRTTTQCLPGYTIKASPTHTSIP
jgi:hypothetical protein